jgi:hypothetical protein
MALSENSVSHIPMDYHHVPHEKNAICFCIHYFQTNPNGYGKFFHQLWKYVDSRIELLIYWQEMQPEIPVISQQIILLME